MKIRRTIIAATAGISLLLAGCTTGGTDTASDSTASQQARAKTEARTLDAENGPVTVDSEPQRVVVLDYASLDTMVSLGLKDRIVETSKSANMPPAAEGIEANAGSLKEPNMEAIAAANPDLIIIGKRQAKMLGEFEKIAPTANLALDYDHYTLESNLKHVEALGAFFGKEKEAKQKADALRDRAREIRESVKPDQERAVIVMTNGGEISLFGPDSRFGIVFNDLGFTPAGNMERNSAHGENASFELLKKLNPQTMFVLDRDATIGEEGHSAKATLDNDLVKSTDASKNDRVYMLNGADWYLNGGGVDSMERMLDDVAAATK